MQRPWLVRPDQVMYVEGYGEVPFVSREAMVAAMMDAEALMARAGGHISIVTERAPTGFPGEMVTTRAVFHWQDRTDAKPQPERPTPVVAAQPPPEPLPDVEAEPEGETGGEETESLFHPEHGAAADVRDSIGDGLDESTLEEEDLSSVPEGVR